MAKRNVISRLVGGQEAGKRFSKIRVRRERIPVLVDLRGTDRLRSLAATGTSERVFVQA